MRKHLYSQISGVGFLAGVLLNASSCTVSVHALSALSANTSVVITPTQLMAAGAASVVAGVCSSAITVTQLDGNSDPIVLDHSTTVSLAGAGSGQLFSDSGCTTPITSVVIPAGSSSVQVYAQDTTAEVLNLGFTSSPATAGSQALTVQASTPVTLTFSGVTSTPANTCTALSVSRADQYGNPAAPASATSITLSGTSKGSFYTTGGCGVTTTTANIPSSSSSTTVYFKSSVVEPTLTLQASGLVTNGTQSLDVLGPFLVSTTVGTASTGFPSGQTTYNLAIGDFDNDGHLDAVVSNTFDSNKVYVAWGDGTGHFSAGPTLSTGVTPSWIKATSLRGNSDLDLIVGNYGASAGSGNLTVILGNGNRTFNAPVSYNSSGTMQYTNGIDTGINLVNTSGKLDVVVTYYGDPTHQIGAGVDVFPGNGDGTLGTPMGFQNDGIGYGAPSVGDLNHDGHLDFVVPLYAGGSANAICYMNKGDGTGFTTSLNNPGIGNFGNVWAFGDFNGDGILDWALGLNDYGLFGNIGDGTTTALNNALADMTMNQSGYRRALTGVYSSSGHTDMLFVGSNTTNTILTNGLIYYPGNGDGTFGAGVIYPVSSGTVTDALVGDFNEDGKLDALVLTEDGVLHLFLGR